MAFPVVFALLDQDVIVRTSSTGSLLQHMDRQVVTLVAYEQVMSAGEPRWLVSVTGRAYAVEDRALIDACRALRLPACGSADVYVRIPVDIVVGQEHRRHDGGPAPSGLGWRADQGER
jgi:hypothetical protein